MVVTLVLYDYMTGSATTLDSAYNDRSLQTSFDISC